MISNTKLISLVSNRYLELILLPTEQCNFRCVYCYEDFSIGKMKPHTVNAIKKLLQQRAPELDVLKLSWFGGEPLAAKDIIFDLSEFVQTLTKSHPNLRYLSGMTTNGFLLKPDLFAGLVALGINHYQISLDGTAAMHNQSRKRSNGGETFDKIWQHLLAMKASDLTFNIIIRLHLTPENVTNMTELVELLKKEFAHDNRFSIFFKTIENLGGPNSGTFKTLHGQDKAGILKYFQDQLDGKLSVNIIDAKEPYVCYAAQTNSFVIRANGRIGKCTVMFHDDRNTLGQLQEDGTILIDADKLALWTRGIKSRDSQDLHCPATKLPKLRVTYDNDLSS